MKKYALTRKINLSRFFPEIKFETIDFHVEDCDTKEEAAKEIKTWSKEYLEEMKLEYKKFLERKSEPTDVPFGPNPFRDNN